MNGSMSPADGWPDPANEPPATPGESAVKQRAAALSILSNSGLILLKLIAGTITGSVAILTEAVHSSIDLVASIVAFFSVCKAGEPADESHRYGHEKIENLSAAIEGILILVPRTTARERLPSGLGGYLRLIAAAAATARVTDA